MDCVTTRLHMEIGMFFLSLTLQGNWENWRNSIWWSANREKIRENDFKKSSEIFSRKCRHFLGGPRIETKFVKWSASRKRLRTAGLGREQDSLIHVGTLNESEKIANLHLL